MEAKPFCRKCLLLESRKEDVLEKIFKLIELMPEKEKANEELYRKRLSVCKTCDSLVNGQCEKCGCYVELRAAKKKERCPHEKRYW